MHHEPGLQPSQEAVPGDAEQRTRMLTAHPQLRPVARYEPELLFAFHARRLHVCSLNFCVRPGLTWTPLPPKDAARLVHSALHLGGSLVCLHGKLASLLGYPTSHLNGVSYINACIELLAVPTRCHAATIHPCLIDSVQTV